MLGCEMRSFIPFLCWHVHEKTRTLPAETSFCSACCCVDVCQDSRTTPANRREKKQDPRTYLAAITKFNATPLSQKIRWIKKFSTS
jgi:hypothetical protein